MDESQRIFLGSISDFETEEDVLYFFNLPPK